MDEAAIQEAAITKKMNRVRGSRRPLPGQSTQHEESLRRPFSEILEPIDAVEALWSVDLARSQAMIELTDAQIAAVQMKLVQEAHKRFGSDQLAVVVAKVLRFGADAFRVHERDRLALVPQPGHAAAARGPRPCR